MSTGGRQTRELGARPSTGGACASSSNRLIRSRTAETSENGSRRLIFIVLCLLGRVTTGQESPLTSQAPVARPARPDCGTGVACPTTGPSGSRHPPASDSSQDEQQDNCPNERHERAADPAAVAVAQ